MNIFADFCKHMEDFIEFFYYKHKNYHDTTIIVLDNCTKRTLFAAEIDYESKIGWVISSCEEMLSPSSYMMRYTIRLQKDRCLGEMKTLETFQDSQENNSDENE